VSKRDVDIIFFVEHAARELDIACAVKFLLEKQYGVSLEIASLVYNLPRTIEKYYKPSVIVIPYCYSALEVGVYDLLRAWSDSTFVNLGWEQIFQRINRSYKAPRDNFSRHHVLHIVWSQLAKDYLTEYGTLDDNILINGNPSLALYGSPYRHFYYEKEKVGEIFGLNPEKRWIFVPENYGAAFYSGERLRNYIRRGAERRTAYNYREFAIASLGKMVRWLKEAARCKDVEIIVRPRPATPEDKFRKAFIEMGGSLPERLHIIKKGTVREWILASDSVVSSYSTSLIEAAVAQRPVSILMPMPFPDYLNNDWYELVSKIRKLSDFMEVVEGNLSEGSWRPLHDWACSNMLSNGDPVANLAYLLSATRQRENCIPNGVYNDFNPKQLLRPPLTFRTRRLVGRLLRTALSQAGVVNGGKLSSYECDEFYPEDIAARVAKWQQVLAY